MEEPVRIPSTHRMGISWALPTVPLPPCTAVTAVPREKLYFKENKSPSLGVAGQEASPRAQRDKLHCCCHLLPKRLLPGDAGG